jgi:hypothetical protein
MKVDKKIQDLLKQVADHFDQEDRAVRDRQLKDWRQLKLLWEGYSRIWFSEVAHDWRVWDENEANSENDQEFYDKPINIFRAYLESIIAALSIVIPAIKCYPDDAENTLDNTTAKAGDKIALLISRHNNVSLLWLRALYILCTEGMVACYTYPKEDDKYGTYEEDKYEDQEEEAYVCPFCKKNLPDEMFISRFEDEFNPGDAESPLHDAILNRGMKICPECASLLDSDLQKSKFTVPRLVGTTKKAKSRICMECYGGLFVKVPNYAMKQADIPYLIFSYETHYSNVLDRYPDLRNENNNGSKINFSGSGIYDPHEQWARLSTQYRGEYPENNVTVRNCWLRPSAFCILQEEDAKLLKEKYPDGAKIVLINDTYADSCNEKLDDCWTIMVDPMADYIHKRPMGSLLVNVQEITSDIISLALQTIEHGISQTFADPGVLNFDQYKQTEVLPGSVYPAIAKTGKAVSDGFFETRTATLSQEVLPFFQQIQGLGQTASGALPSLFGGQIEGSKTASEYSMSRAQALQRLQNTWKMLTMWWKDVFGKVIPMYIQELKEDEKSVERDEQGNFINVFIRIAELEGKIGRVELEANENLPVTWSQRKDTYMKLLETQNEKIIEALTQPENIKNLAEAIGLDDFVIPGQQDVEKQYEEIGLLIQSEPITEPPSEEAMMQAMAQGQDPMELPPVELPSIEPDFDLDNHQVEADTCRGYLIGSAGRILKTENPPGYQNVLLHMKAHLEAMKIKMMQDAQEQAQMQAQSQMQQLQLQQQMAEQLDPKAAAGTNQPLAEKENVATGQ